MLFFLTDSADHVTGKSGLTPTVTLSKSGAAFGAAAGAVTEVGNGWYALAGNATDRGTLGELALHASAALADPFDGRYVIVPIDPFDGASGGMTDIATILTRVSTGVIVTNSPVTLSGETQIWAGYDMLAVNNQALEYTSDGSWPADITGVVTLVTNAMLADNTPYTLVGLVVVATGVGQKVRFEPLAAGTATLRAPYTGRYDISLVKTGDTQPMAIGKGGQLVVRAKPG